MGSGWAMGIIVEAFIAHVDIFTSYESQEWENVAVFGRVKRGNSQRGVLAIHSAILPGIPSQLSIQRKDMQDENKFTFNAVKIAGFRKEGDVHKQEVLSLTYCLQEVTVGFSNQTWLSLPKPNASSYCLLLIQCIGCRSRGMRNECSWQKKVLVVRPGRT